MMMPGLHYPFIYILDYVYNKLYNITVKEAMPSFKVKWN